MSTEQETVLMIRGAIAELSPEKRAAVGRVMSAFDQLAKEEGEDCFTLALAYIGAKLSAACA